MADPCPELTATSPLGVGLDTMDCARSVGTMSPKADSSDSEVEVYKIKHAITGETVLLSGEQQSQQVLFTFTETCPYIPDAVEWLGADGGPGHESETSVSQTQQREEEAQPGTSTVTVKQESAGTTSHSTIPQSRLLWNPHSQMLRRVIGRKESDREEDVQGTGVPRTGKSSWGAGGRDKSVASRNSRARREVGHPYK
ncbi:hypothetical protein K474DRAFT_109167 [Panus rudis PR-1116 ss-1]|nr:hypothetical protein K474DRAFT_109167 [Panus rudis PR-1116 ss-1]